MAIAKIGKLNFVITIISLVIVVLSFSNSYGEEDGKIKWGFSLSLGTDQKSKNDLTMYAFYPGSIYPFTKTGIWNLKGIFQMMGLKIEESFSISFRAHFRPVQEGFRNQYIYCKFRGFFLRMN
jgi:hypothetical protein